MNKLIFDQTKNQFNISLLILYFGIIVFEFFVILLQFNSIDSNLNNIRLFQFLFQFSFLVFFILIVHYSNFYFSFVLILCYQVIFSIFLWSFYYMSSEPLGFNPNDSLIYQNALEESFGRSYGELIKILKSNPRTASLSDWGYPTYRFLIYKMVPYLMEGLLATVIINAFFHSISCIFVFKIAKRYLANEISIIVMSLWGLSATSIFVNASGLKETIFSFFVILAIHNLVEIEYGKKIKRTFFFFFFTLLIWFFRNYLSIFLVLVYLGCYPFRKVFYKFYVFFFISIFFICFFGMEFLSNVLPALKFVQSAREDRMSLFFGSTGIIANCMNFFFAWITPIPKVNATAKIEQLLYSGFAIYKAFFSLFAIYSIFLILKQKQERFYPILTFMTFNIVLVIITCNSLDYRFLHPSVYIDFILILFGFSEIQINGLGGKLIKKFNISFVIVVFFSIIFLLMSVYNK